MNSWADSQGMTENDRIYEASIRYPITKCRSYLNVRTATRKNRLHTRIGKDSRQKTSRYFDGIVHCISNSMPPSTLPSPSTSPSPPRALRCCGLLPPPPRALIIEVAPKNLQLRQRLPRRLDPRPRPRHRPVSSPWSIPSSSLETLQTLRVVRLPDPMPTTRPSGR